MYSHFYTLLPYRNTSNIPPDQTMQTFQKMIIIISLFTEIH